MANAIQSIDNFGGIDMSRGSWQHVPDRERDWATSLQGCSNFISIDGSCRLRTGLVSSFVLGPRDTGKWCRCLLHFSLPNQSINLLHFGDIIGRQSPIITDDTATSLTLTDNDGIILTDNEGVELTE